MGKLFGKLTTDKLEQAEDRLGGAQPLESGIYDAVVKMAYAGESARGAAFVTVIFDINGRELRSTQYVTKATGENYYADKNDPKKKHPLPGFTVINDLCLLTTGEELSDQNTEEKLVKIYDFETKKEVPTEVPVLVDLLNKEIKVGLVREIVWKTKRDDSGNWVDTNETRMQNEIDKLFHHETMKTVVEYRQEVETPEFYNAWKERNTGRDRDRTAGGAGASGSTGAGSTGTGRPGGQSQKKSLFGKN